jgi:uncharacterized protein YceK
VKPIFFAIALVIAALASGCGSFLGRMTQRPKPYPGLRFIFDELPKEESRGIAQVLWLDAPISLVADTVLLPIDALNASSDKAK